MEGGFQNPPVGNQGILLRPAIRSPNFVHNTAGWTINRDGSAEFNNLVVRNGQIISGTALYYSGPAAAGNLIASVAAAAGTDSFGNAYLADVTVYDTVNNVAVQLAPSGIAFYTGPAGGGGPWTGGNRINFNTGNLQLIGPIIATLGLTLSTGNLTVSAGSVTAANGLLAQAGGVIVQGGGASIIGGLDVATGVTTLEHQVVVGANAASTTADLEVHTLVALIGQAAPGTPPAGTGFLYVNSSTGALHFKGHSGTDTQIAPG